jgi:hypothetical protein
MKFWKGLPATPKAGQVGTMEDTGFVPDSVQATQAEYDAWVAALPVPVPVITQLQADIAALSFLSLDDAKTKVQVLLERLRKGEK